MPPVLENADAIAAAQARDAADALKGIRAALQAPAVAGSPPAPLPASFWAGERAQTWNYFSSLRPTDLRSTDTFESHLRLLALAATGARPSEWVLLMSGGRAMAWQNIMDLCAKRQLGNARRIVPLDARRTALLFEFTDTLSALHFWSNDLRLALEVADVVVTGPVAEQNFRLLRTCFFVDPATARAAVTGRAGSWARFHNDALLAPPCLVNAESLAPVDAPLGQLRSRGDAPAVTARFLTDVLAASKRAAQGQGQGVTNDGDRRRPRAGAMSAVGEAFGPVRSQAQRELAQPTHLTPFEVATPVAAYGAGLDGAYLSAGKERALEEPHNFTALTALGITQRVRAEMGVPGASASAEAMPLPEAADVYTLVTDQMWSGYFSKERRDWLQRED